VWLADEPVPVETSPKFQESLYGEVPPDAEPVKETDGPTCGEDGLKVKLALRATVTVMV